MKHPLLSECVSCWIWINQCFVWMRACGVCSCQCFMLHLVYKRLLWSFLSLVSHSSQSQMHSLKEVFIRSCFVLCCGLRQIYYCFRAEPTAVQVNAAFLSHIESNLESFSCSFFTATFDTVALKLDYLSLSIIRMLLLVNKTQQLCGLNIQSVSLTAAVLM